MKRKRLHGEQRALAVYLLGKIGQPLDRRRDPGARVAVLLVIEQPPMTGGSVLQGDDKVLAILALEQFTQPIGSLKAIRPRQGRRQIST